MSDLSDLARAISDLFDAHGPLLIIRSLADRLVREQTIAHGEGRKEDSRRWASLAEDLDSVADDHEPPPPATTTPEEVAQRFISAGYAKEEVQEADLAAIGVVVLHPGTFASWEALCRFVYITLTEKPMPECDKRGRGFRSQWYGKTVAEAIRAKYAQKEQS